METRELLQKLFPNVSLPTNVVREVSIPYSWGAGVPLCWQPAPHPCGLLLPKGFPMGGKCFLLLIPVIASRRQAELNYFEKSVRFAFFFFFSLTSLTTISPACVTVSLTEMVNFQGR